MMTENDSPFFLFLSSTLPEAAASKLKASHVLYRQKRLDSSAENWDRIVEFLLSPRLTGVMGKLSTTIYNIFTHPSHAEVGPRLLAGLAQTRHIIFVHESLLTGEVPLREPTGQDDEDEEYEEYFHYFARATAPASPEVRDAVGRLLEDNNINILPYQTNAELSVLAADFIEDSEKNLLFRIYVPRNRLYASEADKLLDLFRDWLGQVGNFGVRQGAYATPAGRVFEFFGDEFLAAQDLPSIFDDFSNFIEMCTKDPSKAENRLVELGATARSAASLVSKYARESRRIRFDLQQAREEKVFFLKQRLRSELYDETEAQSNWSVIEKHIENAVPAPLAAIGLGLMPVSQERTASSNLTINVDQRIINAINSTVFQEVQGSVTLGAEPKEILRLITEFGGAHTRSLESAIQELEDEDARPEARLRASKQIKGFLIRVSGKIETTTFTLLEAYIKSKMGG